jgi:eukaryotic-like serine/threonine-protein kinase
VPVEATPEEREEWLSRQQAAAPKAEEAPPPEDVQPQEAPPKAEEVPPPEDARPREDDARDEAPPRERHTWRVGHLALVGLLLLAGLFLASWLVRSTLSPPHMSEPTTAFVALEKGSAPVLTTTTSQDSAPTRGSSSLRFLAVWLCTATGLGCPAAQVRPPEPENCSEEAKRNMFEVLKLNEGMRFDAIVDINQPGDHSQEGTYHDGPIIGRVVQEFWSRPQLPAGTLLYGRLWTGPGIQTRDGEDAVLGRYTEALLPDGRKLSVCIVLGSPEGRWPKNPGSTPGAVRLDRELAVAAVRRWP